MPFGGTSSAAMAVGGQTTTASKTPAAPKPGPDWVPTADGQGWLPPDRAGTAGAAPPTGGAANPPGTTAAGVKPPSPVPTPTPSTTVTGAGGTASLSTGANGVTTGQAPSIPLGNTTANDPLQQLMRSRITEMLNSNPNAVSVTDPDLAPAAQAYSAQRERAQREELKRQQAQMNSMGLNSSGARDAAEAQAIERTGQDVGAYQSQLVLDKMQSRQRSLEAAITAANQLGMSEEAANLSRQLSGLTAQMSMFQIGQGQQGQQLQTQLANMDTNTKTYLANLDADLRRQGYTTTERLGIMDNELRRYGIDVQGNLGLLNAVIGLMGMDQQNTQFNQSLGANLGMFGSNFNWNQLIPLMNG